jgi:multidrug efflux system membrane fusion protein
LSFGSFPRPLALIFGVILVSFLIAGCDTSAQQADGGSGGRGGRAGRGGRGGTQPVVVAKVTRKDVPVEIAAVGNVEASNLIAVRSQVTGTLERVGFNAGDFVKRGDMLFSIDRRPLEAALQQAEANLTRDEALLNQAEAQMNRDASSAEYQSLNAERQAQLVTRGIVSKDAGDQARAQADAISLTVKADKAAIASAQAQLKVQQAAVDAAKLQLAYTTIPSPIDGRTSDIQVKPGNLVSANNTQLATVAQVEPVYVTFSVPAVHLPAIKAATTGNKQLKVIAVPQDGNSAPVEGRLTFWDNIVDATTDTIKLKGTFGNSDHRLWPGQFARVTLELSTLSNATVVPQQAILTGQDGSFVFVVKDNMTVEQRPVVVGQRAGDDMVVEKGLEPGETVVTEGQLRLEQGTRVQLTDGSGSAPVGGATTGRSGRGGRGGRRGGNAS